MTMTWRPGDNDLETWCLVNITG